MHTAPKRVYIFLLAACFIGYGWIFLTMKIESTKCSFSPCPIKNITSIPCPSCGSTRSVVALFQGHFKEAFLFNPLGYFAAFFLLVIPIWIIYDALAKKKTLFHAYRKAEQLLCKPLAYLPAIGMIVFIWIWNITKAL